MAEEPIVEEVVVPSDDSNPEAEQTDLAAEQTLDQIEATEPVDESGVPIKNRQAEAARKARQVEKAQRELLSPAAQPRESDDDSIRTMERIAEEKVMKRLEPILAKQFLMENPGAAEMIEDINRVRAENPELASIEKLEVAYKVAKAERQDELIRQGVEAESRDRAETLSRAEKAGSEGVGRVKAPTQTVADRLAGASSLKELQELEALIASQ